MNILRVIFCIRDEHETVVATLDMWKFRVVTVGIRARHRTMSQPSRCSPKEGRHEAVCQ